MEQNTYISHILDSVCHLLKSDENALFKVLYVLYGIHKNYDIIDNGEKFHFVADNEDLLCNSILDKTDINCNTIDLYKNLSQIPYREFENAYIETIKGSLNYQASRQGPYGAFFSPFEISSLIAYFINKSNCKSVFDPFCGTASIVHYFKDRQISFHGQEINELISVIARINMEAHYGSDKGISCVDSITQWNQNHFDAIVSCPPFYISINPNELKNLREKEDILSSDTEGIFFQRAFKVNQAKIVISIEPPSFLWDVNHKKIRRYLVDNNYLDTIIKLPKGLLFNTSIPCAMIICKSNRANQDPVKFINASSFFTGESISSRSFNIDKFIKIIDKSNSPIQHLVKTRKIVDFDYSLTYEIYTPEVKLKDGQKSCLMGDLFFNVNYTKVPSSKNTSYKVYPTNRLKYKLIDIWINFKNSIDDNNDITVDNRAYNKLYHCDSPATYLLYYRGYPNSRFGLLRSQDDFICHKDVRVVKIKEEIINPEYLIFIMLNLPIFSTNSLSISLDEYKKQPVVIDSIEKQTAKVESIKQEYAEKKRKEQEFEVQRLGLKQNISDLEHMLGPTEMRLNNIIYKLEKSSKEDQIKDVIQLRDNLEYLFRLIRNSNADFSKVTFNIIRQDFIDYINKYAEAWKNYNGDYFNLSINNETGKEELQVDFSDQHFTVLLDSILNNAIRHGFNKIKKEGNLVEINISFTVYQEKKYLLIAVKNNGKPFPEDFSTTDYISRGHYSYLTGRSGLGGYHVHQIVKKHSGYLNIDTNKIWNVIINILLPVDNNVSVYPLKEFENECI